MENKPNSFIGVMEGLVSNDSAKRKKNLSELNKVIIEIISNENDCQEDFGKIWKSLFYLFWNTDKPVNQKLTADDIAFKLELFGEKQLTVDYINSFLTEFLKKWSKIDFLRLDKYIMLVQTVMKKFFEVCLEYKNLDFISSVIIHMKTLVTSEIYNFSFTFNVLKCFSYLIEIIFEKGILEEEQFKQFSEHLIELFICTRDSREIDSFKDNIMKKLSEKLMNVQNLRDVLLERLFERASSKEDYPENKRRLLFKFYKHLKYIIVNEENGEVNNYPLEDPKQYSQIDPVNEITLKSNYTNLNIAGSLKKRILNSVIKHTKRAKKVMLEWQNQKENENNKEGENENKIEVEKLEIPNIVKNGIKNSIITKNNDHEEIQIEEKIKVENQIKVEKDECPILENHIESGKLDRENENQNNTFLLFQENPEQIKELPKKTKKISVFKKKLKEEIIEDKEMDDDFDEFVESLKNKLNANGNPVNEELINEINNDILPKKRKSVQILEKNRTKKRKKNDVSLTTKSKKKVTFNLSENLINNYDLQKPITLISNKSGPNGSLPNKGVLKNPKIPVKNKVI